MPPIKPAGAALGIAKKSSKTAQKKASKKIAQKIAQKHLYNKPASKDEHGKDHRTPKEKATNKHMSNLEVLLEHVTVTNSTEGGACLWRPDHGRWSPKSSCNFGWQSYIRAHTPPDLPRYQPTPHPTWWIGIFGNFQSAYLPYHNNAHHMIPYARLHEGMDSSVGGVQALGIALRVALLKEQYNLNHMTNMILLPNSDVDAQQAALPQHNGNHPLYSARVLAKLKTIFGRVVVAGPPCNIDTTKMPACKQELLALQDGLRREIFAAGLAKALTSPGAWTRLDDIPDSTFAGIPPV